METNPAMSPQESTLKESVSGLLKLVAMTEPFLVEAEKLQNDDVRRCLAFLGPMWLHGMAMCDSLRPRGEGRIMWNLPALAVLARTMIECFIGLAHVCESMTEEERQHRSLLWERQACYKTSREVLS